MKFLYSILFLLIPQNSISSSSDSTGEENLYLEIPKISIVHKNLPCQLQWRNSTKGPAIDTDYVTISSRNVGRVKTFGQYTFGLISPQMDPSTIPTGLFYSSSEDRFLEFRNYEILTNPNKCHLIWESVVAEDGGWVCRTPHCIGLWANATLPEICTPSEDFKKCVPSQKSNSNHFMEFEILRSVKRTLDYRVDDLKLMENEILDVVNFRGADRILNKVFKIKTTTLNTSLKSGSIIFVRSKG